MCAGGDCKTSERKATSQRVPDPSVRIELGAPFGDPESCGSGGRYQNCHYTDWYIDGFEPHQTLRGTCHALRASDGQHMTWEDPTLPLDKNGQYNGGQPGCWPHGAHQEVWIVLEGTESNHLKAPW